MIIYSFTEFIILVLSKEIYIKYISVSAYYSIDCPKAERLKVHHLFNENNAKTSLVSLKANSVFIPTYEDTFDAIEEFLLLSLYDDWKIFMETEENYFKHVTNILLIYFFLPDLLKVIILQF